MTFAGCILAFFSALPTPDSLPEIDHAVYAFMAENNTPGISLAITKNEELVYLRGYGYADKEAREKVTSNSLFRVASISKPITSMAIMKLAEEKKLSLDDKVFGPQGILKTTYGKKQPYTADIREITVRHLLQHLSGGWETGKTDPMFMDPSVPMDELITRTLDSRPLENKPGTQYAYSNFGYCLLGRIIEKVSGQRYETYVKNNILLPAGISSMQIGGNALTDKKPDEVKYYGQNEDPYCCNITRMDAHGGWIAPAKDLVNLLLRVDGKNKVKDLLSPASLKTMFTGSAVLPAYACGWNVDSLGNIGHSGGLPGTRTEFRQNANGYGYAILMNTRSVDSLFSKNAKELIDFIQTVQIGGGERGQIFLPGYKPAQFVDSGRIQKMKAAFPLIENMYREYAKKNNIPGLVFGIVGDNQLVYSAAFGYSDVAKKTPVTASSVYRIASVTKSFSAMAIMQLRDAGKLQLDDPVSKFIPEMQNIVSLTDDSPPIAIRNLLTHTAGFPEDNPWGDRQLQRTDEELISFIKKGVSLSSTPGMAYEYSNLGFTLLGRIITKASGMHYEKYIRENIFTPLGMDHTYWEYTEAPAELLTHGYRIVNGQWTEEEMLHSGAYGAMGGMLTSIDDFSKYMNLHLSAWPPRSGGDSGIVRRSSLREMHLPGKISSLNAYARNPAGAICPRISSYNFGLAWSKDCTGKEQVGHSGGLPGFGANWVILPEYGIGIVSFCNLTYAGAGALNIRALDTLIALAGLQPRQLPSSTILERRKNELASILPDWQNAVSSGIFSENFFLDYFLDSLKKEAKTLFDKAGKISRIGDVSPDNQLRGNFIMEGENVNILVRFTLSPENPGLIQEYHIREISKSETSFQKYKLKTVSGIAEYKATVDKDPNQQLVALDALIPGISLDIRYASPNNLMKRQLYKIPAAYMRRPAAEALKKIQAELHPLGYGLKIYDGYRPYSVSVIFYEAYRDTIFVASPYTGSRHNRGCAVDLTLIDLKTGKELNMPTPYDTFSKKASSTYSGLSPKILKNRELLKKVMTSNGFAIYPDEWWHYDFIGWENYPVMDLSFEKLQQP